MTPRSQLLNVLHLALVDIRADAHEHGGKVSFHLADLFHNVPLALDREIRDGGDGSAALRLLRERAEEKGLTKWLDQVLPIDTEGDDE
jgi:hypothetical protein